jgi:hypothetical protein
MTSVTEQQLSQAQIVAAERHIVGAASKAFTRIHHDLMKPVLTEGLIRTYQPDDAENGVQLPPEEKRVQLTVPQALQDAQFALAQMFDAVATKEAGNCIARADVVLSNGTVLIENAPVMFLVWLDTKLQDVHTFLTQLPVLDPAERWTADDNDGLYKADPKLSHRKEKLPRNHLLAAATKEHPAQVQMYYEDVNVGVWTQVNFSGSIRAQDRDRLVARVRDVMLAVKRAREKANETLVVPFLPGEVVLRHIFG